MLGLMVLARYSLAPPHGALRGRSGHRMWLFALIIAVACALAVFAALSARENSSSHPVVSTKRAASPAGPSSVAAAVENKPASAVQPAPAPRADGTVAKTHSELIALALRSPDKFTEFTLPRSRRFRRLGPFSVQLKKIDPRRGTYELSVMVSGQNTINRRANLYEPISLPSSEGVESSEIVVNRVARNRVSGYLRQPRAHTSERAASMDHARTRTPEPAAN